MLYITVLRPCEWLRIFKLEKNWWEFAVDHNFSRDLLQYLTHHLSLNFLCISLSSLYFLAWYLSLETLAWRRSWKYLSFKLVPSETSCHRLCIQILIVKLKFICVKSIHFRTNYKYFLTKNLTTEFSPSPSVLQRFFISPSKLLTLKNV